MELCYEIEFSTLVREIRAYNPNLDVYFLKSAYYFSYEAHRGQLRKSGDPYFQHCLEVVKILSNLRLDSATIASGLLHDVIGDTEIGLEEVEEKFGVEVAVLVDGVSRIHRLKTMNSKEHQDKKYVENYIEMLLTVVKDIRVVLIKLADRLHNMRTLKYLPEKKRQEISIETRLVYIPLANRLGLAKIKSELEDLVFKFLDNELYKAIAIKVNEKRQQREQYTQSIAGSIQEKLLNGGVKSRVEGRPKSLYSIYKKSQNRNLAFEEMYDLFAIRIIVEKVEECYQALSIVHTHFTPCLNKFHDYIVMPKPNGYQSLHSVIQSQENRLVEVQIRTEEMHKVANDGIAAHWKYKEGKLEYSRLDQYLVDFRQWLHQIPEWLQEAQGESNEILDHFKISHFKNEIFVYTPQGKLLRLPTDSTPVDFAFAVHTDLGIHCLGAKVNGKMVTLNHKLKSGDTVEIIENSHQKPNIEWINFVRTAKASAKIKHWFKESMLEQSQKLGETIVQHEFRRLSIKKANVDIDALAKSFGLTSVPQLYHAIGVNRISASQVIKRVSLNRNKDRKTNFHGGLKIFDHTQHLDKGILVDGLNDVLIQFAKCCQPLPGDRILGFVTKGNGVIIHCSSCKNISKLMDNPERYLYVDWNGEHDENFLVRLQMLGHDRKNFLRDISDAIAQTHTNIVKVIMNAQDSFIQGHIVIEVEDLLHLTKVLQKISKINGVINVERLDGGGEPVADLVSDVSSVWNKAN